MSRTAGWILAALVAGGGIGAFYYFWNHPDWDMPAPPADEQELAGAQGPGPYEPEDAIRHPIPDDQAGAEAVAPQPLPELNLSDLPVRRTLEDMLGESIVARHLVPERIVRRVVITVDNLPREKLAVQMRPVKPLGGQVAVVGDADLDEKVILSAENYARYTPVIRLLQSIDAEQLAGLYLRLYPLFQQAYEELGYPDKYFNDRLVQTIDHLLETPEIGGEIELVRPKVFFEYADPGLEHRSAGQKLLIRMGAENAAVVKEKLRALRAAVTRSQNAPAAP